MMSHLTLYVFLSGPLCRFHVYMAHSIQIVDKFMYDSVIHTSA